MTGSCSACAQSAKVRESESGVNQPPAPSTNTQSARPSSSRSPLESLAAAIEPPFVGADDVCGGGRLGEGIGVHLVVTQCDPTMTLQRQRIFITQPIAGKLATGGHRLIAGSVKTQQIRRLQQGAAGDGFTDFGIGPGDKKRLVTLNDSCKKRIRQRADALPLRPGQLQLAQLAAAKRGDGPPLVQMGGADALQRAHAALSASANGRLI